MTGPAVKREEEKKCRCPSIYFLPAFGVCEFPSFVISVEPSDRGLSQ